MKYKIDWEIISVIAITFFTVYIILTTQSAKAETIINSCQTLNLENETYKLNESIINRVGSCFTIENKNMTLDCDNFLIDGDDTGIDYALVNTSLTTGAKDFTFKNCLIGGFSYGFRFWNYDNLIIENVNVTTSNINTGSIYGGYLSNGKNTNINNFIVYNNSRVSSSAGLVLLNLTNVYLNNIIIENQYSGISTSGFLKNVSLNNMNIINGSSFGIRITSANNLTDVVIQNSNISNNNLKNYITSELIYIHTSITDNSCNNLSIINILGNNLLPIEYFNSQTIIENRSFDIGDIILCNADNSELNNIFSNNNIYSRITDNIEITNSYFENNNKLAFYLSNNVLINNITTLNSKFAAIENTRSNITIINSNIDKQLEYESGSFPYLVLCGGNTNINNTYINSNFNYDTGTYAFYGTIDTCDNFNLNIYNSSIYGNITAMSFSSGSGISNVNIFNSEISRISNDLNFGSIYSYSVDYGFSDSSIYNLYNVSFTDYYINRSTLNIYWKLTIDNPNSANIDIYDNNDTLYYSSNSENINLWIKEYNVIPINYRTNETTQNLKVVSSKAGHIGTIDYLNMTDNNYLYVSLIPMLINCSISLDINPSWETITDSYCIGENYVKQEYNEIVLCGNYTQNITKTRVINCPYGCGSDMSVYGDDCLYPAWIFYLVVIILFVGFILILNWVSK